MRLQNERRGTVSNYKLTQTSPESTPKERKRLHRNAISHVKITADLPVDESKGSLGSLYLTSFWRMIERVFESRKKSNSRKPFWETRQVGPPIKWCIVFLAYFSCQRLPWSSILKAFDIVLIALSPDNGNNQHRITHHWIQYQSELDENTARKSPYFMNKISTTTI